VNPLKTMKRAKNKIMREGAVNSIVQVCLRLESYYFDLKHGVDTYSNVPLSDLKIDDSSVEFGRRYQPILVSHLKEILRQIKPDCSDVLVDYGSGKGRVLLISSMYPFKRVVGVEFSQELCTTAQKNADIFRKDKRNCPIEIHCMDAAVYPVDPEETVFFFFNPFDTAIMGKVIRNIEMSYEAHPRNMKIVFINLESQPLEQSSTLFSRITDSNLHGLPFQIYATK
jgi:hypothetical protein